MKVLIPEKVNFKISTTNIHLTYQERNDTKIIVEALTLNNYPEKKEYTRVEFTFRMVAELRCVSLNFFESYYDEFKIEKVVYDNLVTFWKNNNYCPDSGFYAVADSSWLEKLNQKYDPHNQFNLQHYLITGYDSFVELLASSYSTIIPET